MERLCSFVTRARGSLSLVREREERGCPKRTFFVSYSGELSELSCSDSESEWEDESEDESAVRECCLLWEREVP